MEFQKNLNNFYRRNNKLCVIKTFKKIILKKVKWNQKKVKVIVLQNPT